MINKKHLNELFDFGRIRWLRCMWLPLSDKEKGMTYDWGEPILSADKSMKLVKIQNVFCRFKDWTDSPITKEPREGGFRIPKATCLACENYEKGYCVPKVEDDRESVAERLAKANKDLASAYEKVFS